MVEGSEGFQLEERPYGVNDWEIIKDNRTSTFIFVCWYWKAHCGEASALLALWKGSATLPFTIDGVYL